MLYFETLLLLLYFKLNLHFLLIPSLDLKISGSKYFCFSFLLHKSVFLSLDRFGPIFISSERFVNQKVNRKLKRLFCFVFNTGRRHSPNQPNTSKNKISIFSSFFHVVACQRMNHGKHLFRLPPLAPTPLTVPHSLPLSRIQHERSKVVVDRQSRLNRTTMNKFLASGKSKPRYNNNNHHHHTPTTTSTCLLSQQQRLYSSTYTSVSELVAIECMGTVSLFLTHTNVECVIGFFLCIFHLQLYSKYFLIETLKSCPIRAYLFYLVLTLTSAYFKLAQSTWFRLSFLINFRKGTTLFIATSCRLSQSTKIKANIMNNFGTIFPIFWNNCKLKFWISRSFQVSKRQGTSPANFKRWSRCASYWSWGMRTRWPDFQSDKSSQLSLSCSKWSTILSWWTMLAGNTIIFLKNEPYLASFC